MRSKILVQTIMIALVATVALTGCKGPGSKKPTMNGGQTGPGGVPPIGDGVIGGGPLNSRELTGADYSRRGLFDLVYFDYDSAQVKPSEVAKLEAVATWMKAKSGKLMIEGHADERGTSEYNRSLGEKRALACREQLVRLGVNADRIATISYGKDKPAVEGHDEASWAKNRRCEFAVSGS